MEYTRTVHQIPSSCILLPLLRAWIWPQQLSCKQIKLKALTSSTFGWNKSEGREEKNIWSMFVAYKNSTKNKQTNKQVTAWIINTYGTGSRPLLWSHKSNSSFSDVVGIRWHPELFCKWNKCNFNDSLPLFRKWFTPKELLNFAVAIFQIAIDMHCAIQLFCLLIKYCWCSLKYNTSLEQQ